MQRVSGKASTITTSRARLAAKWRARVGRPSGPRGVLRDAPQRALGPVSVGAPIPPVAGRLRRLSAGRGLRRGRVRRGVAACSPLITYTGVDVSGPLVAAARRAHPEHEFLQADCADGVPLPHGYADIVSAMGWLHWETRYAQALAELWRLTARYAFFDLRLTPGPGPDTTA